MTSAATVEEDGEHELEVDILDDSTPYSVSAKDAPADLVRDVEVDDPEAFIVMVPRG